MENPDTLQSLLRRKGLLLSPLLLALTFCGASRGRSAIVPPSADPPAPAAPGPVTAPIYAQIWMDFAPEYRALCLQTFNSALQSVREQVNLAPRLGGRPVDSDGKPLAVVADLDETILDNSGYQANLIVEGKGYTPQSWEEWVARIRGVRLLPGAAEFIRQVEALGVTMIYLSNRRETSREATLETLRRLAIATPGLEDPSTRRLLLQGGESDKQPRREAAAAQYGIIAYLGDNLGDFPGTLSDDLGQRLNSIDSAADFWGKRWFVLPNPTYGSWTDVFRGLDPIELLRRLTEEENRN